MLDSERMMNEVQSVLQAFLPRSQQALVDNLAALAADRGLLGVEGIVSPVVSSCLLLRPVRIMLNQVFGVQQSRTFIRLLGE